jgi:hypothetical protein
VTSIERTAYPRFKRLITAHELHLFFSPTRDEVAWASEVTDCDEHLLALLLMLKSYQRMGCAPRLEDVPGMVVDFLRRAVELPEDMLPLYQAVKTAKTTGVWCGSGWVWSTTRPRPGGSPRRRSAARPRRRTVRRI